MVDSPYNKHLTRNKSRSLLRGAHDFSNDRFLGETWAQSQLSNAETLISMVGAIGIEPTTSQCEGNALPLSYGSGRVRRVAARTSVLIHRWLCSPLSNRPPVGHLSLPKIRSIWIRNAPQNHRIIKFDACEPALTHDVRRRHIQVATQARSREPVSPSSAQHRIEASAASSAAVRQ